MGHPLARQRFGSLLDAEELPAHHKTVTWSQEGGHKQRSEPQALSPKGFTNTKVMNDDCPTILSCYHCQMQMENDEHRPWAETEPGQLIANGHGAGDILEAPKWLVVDEQPGLLTVQVHLPEALKNPQGQLFGGFTPTYVDMVSLYTVHTLSPGDDPTSPRSWLTTINMRCDYFEPIVADTFIIKGEVENQRGLTSLVSAKFYQDNVMAAHALTTIRQLPNVG